jgi:hypothetical protein
MAKRRKPKRDEQPETEKRVERKPAPPSPNPYAWRNRVAEWFNK